jgi:hypothetical protein
LRDGAVEPDDETDLSDFPESILVAHQPTTTYDISPRIESATRLPLKIAKVQVGRGVLSFILEGVPGTGKTYALKDVQSLQHRSSYGAVGDGSFAITLHPATAYEDFVEGIRPSNSGRTTDQRGPGAVVPAGRFRRAPSGEYIADGGTTEEAALTYFYEEEQASDSSAFRVIDGFFVRCCRAATQSPEKWFVILLDEINRCNIPKVFGDLLTTVESSKRARWVKLRAGSAIVNAWDLSQAQTVTLPYSGRVFFVPDNVVVVGTMNTTDRSVAPMDAALRRRFAFVRVWPVGFDPEETPIKPGAALPGLERSADDQLFQASVDLWLALNRRLHAHGDDALLGHSYLYALHEALSGSQDEEIRREITCFHWNHYIFPQVVDILQSNDLELKVFGPTPRPSGALEELGGAEAGQPGLFVGKLPSAFTGQWTRRGEGMLRTVTLRISMAQDPKVVRPLEPPSEQPSPATANDNVG